jgi:AraC-like DNA-binding protein/CheY-like chemotaxis protein
MRIADPAVLSPPLPSPSRQPRPRVLLAGGAAGWQAATGALLGGGCQVRAVGNDLEMARQTIGWTPDVVVLDVSAGPVDTLRVSDFLRRQQISTKVLVHVPEASSPNPMSRPTSAAGPATGPVLPDAPFDGLCSGIRAVAVQVAGLLRLRRPPPGGSGARHVATALTFVAAGYDRHLRVADVATGTGVSAAHLGHVFRKDMHMTVQEYLTRVRVEVAKQVLVTCSAPLETVAERSGFFDAPHLARTFRRIVGCTPGDYRRNVGHLAPCHSLEAW